MTASLPFSVRKSVIGMIHLPPLPGAPGFEISGGGLRTVIDGALRDASALAEGGCTAVMLENFGDAPFFPGRVPAITVAAMTAVAVAVRQAFPQIPLGINILRNDGLSALAVAAAVDAAMIRVNVLTGARVTDQGLVTGIAHDLMRERRTLGAAGVAVWADVDVKHSAALAARPLEDEVKDTALRGLADALIVSGSGTGAEVDPAKVASVKRAAAGRPVLIGSGASIANIAALAAHADGFIVGTAFKQGGDVQAPVDAARVKAFVAAL